MACRARVEASRHSQRRKAFRAILRSEPSAASPAAAGDVRQPPITCSPFSSGRRDQPERVERRAFSPRCRDHRRHRENDVDVVERHRTRQHQRGALRVAAICSRSCCFLKRLTDALGLHHDDADGPRGADASRQRCSVTELRKGQRTAGLRGVVYLHAQLVGFGLGCRRERQWRRPPESRDHIAQKPGRVPARGPT